MRPFPFKVWFWYTFRKHWDGECLVLAPYSHVLGTQPTSFPDTRICILFLKVLPAATPAHWDWLPRWGLWAPRAMAHLFIVPLLWMINKGIFHSLSTKIRRIPEAVGSLNLYFFSHLIVVQMEVIHCVNVCLLFSFYCMHFYFSLSSVFPSHVAQKIKQGAPNYLIFGLIKFSCSALCWWECVDDERWWDFPFFPPLPLQEELSSREVTSDLCVVKSSKTFSVCLRCNSQHLWPGPALELFFRAFSSFFPDDDSLTSTCSLSSTDVFSGGIPRPPLLTSLRLHMDDFIFTPGF